MQETGQNSATREPDGSETPGPVLRVAAIKENAPGERRVALAPESIASLREASLGVLIESGAGSGAWFTDESYTDAGAEILGSGELVDRADVIVTVGTWPAERVGQLRAGQTLIGMLQPLTNPDRVQALALRGVTAISLDGLPRTLSRAQTMDALTSQANTAGYKAMILAADHFPGFFPMMISAAGTAKPAEVLVLGAGVAGLQAMSTARRLGAVVSGYDVRPETRDQVESVGARFLELKSVGPASGEGGYARALTPEEEAAQKAELAERISRFDVVITTAQVPGRRPPLLVSAQAIDHMRPGSVVVDLAASNLGGNVEGSQPDATIVTDRGVTLIGAANLAAQVPSAASKAFSHNVAALLLDMVRDGSLKIDPADEVQAGVVVTHGGEVVHPVVRERLGLAPIVGPDAAGSGATETAAAVESAA